MVSSTPFVHVGEVNLNTKTWKFNQISFKNHYMYSNRFGSLYNAIMEMTVNKDATSFRNLLTMLTKSMVLEHVMLCMQNYVDYYAASIKHNEHYSLIKNFVLRLTTVSLEEALIDCTQLHERMRTIGEDLHMIDFECQIRKSIDNIRACLFPAVNNAYAVLRTSIVKLTNKLKDLLIVYHLEDLTVQCQKCKCGYIYHQHKDCSHKLCAKCAFQSLFKVKYCIMCKKLEKIRNREIDNIDHSDSETEYSANNVISSSKDNNNVNDNVDENDDDNNNSEDDSEDENDSEEDEDNDLINDEAKDDNDVNNDYDVSECSENDEDHSNNNDNRPNSARSSRPVSRRSRRRSVASSRRSTSSRRSRSSSSSSSGSESSHSSPQRPPIRRRKRIIDRSIFSSSRSASPTTTTTSKHISSITRKLQSPSRKSSSSPEECIEAIDRHLHLLNKEKNKLNAQINEAEEEHHNNSNASIVTCLPENVHIDDNANDIPDITSSTPVLAAAPSNDAPDDAQNCDTAYAIRLSLNFEQEIMAKSPHERPADMTYNNDEILNMFEKLSSPPPRQQESVLEYIPPVQQQAIEKILPSPLRSRVTNSSVAHSSKKRALPSPPPIGTAAPSSPRDIKPIIKTEPRDIPDDNDEPFEFFQYHCVDGIIVKLEKDNPVYLDQHEAPYQPPPNDDDSSGDEDDVIIVGGDEDAFKPKRFPIKLTKYAHVVSEEYIGDDEPSVKKFKLEKK
ncbi:hoar [Spodoptera litura nucleopolyhedrovirus II]|uniref:hoar n=1 Tax=Spodoptera litura nucleopolyhedrovirus II TaxID=566270 RepID=UPI0001874642|nr:hoar [Spodoptera litura nucleopolyhedrovirus II]ACI47373.1 hoar [Spodoptera litura nucleopolyhedrovirus II]